MSEMFPQYLGSAEPDRQSRPTNGEELMAALGLDVGRELREYKDIYPQASGMTTYSDILGNKFSQRLFTAHRASFIMQKYGIDDPSAAEISEYCKTEAWRYLETFPEGTELLVATVQPGSFNTFTVGHNNMRLDFSDHDEAVLIDAEKSVALTFHDPERENPRSEEVPNYQFWVQLPEAFDRTVRN